MNRGIKALLAASSLATLSGCLQYYNSSSQDPSKYRAPIVIDTSSPGGQRFAAAYDVIDKRCVECHDQLASFSTEAQFKTDEAFKVIPGDLAGSKLYSVLRGSGVGGVENMPEDGMLKSTEIGAIRDWIEQMTP